MKTILAFSDSHGYPIPDRVKDVANESDYVFFLGDGIAMLDDLLYNKNLTLIQGNCDGTWMHMPSEEVVEIEGVKILLTHGHRYGVKNSLLDLTYRAQELGCDAAFYGHTHMPAIDDANGVQLICPGALSPSCFGPPSYAYAVVANSKLTAKIVQL